MRNVNVKRFSLWAFLLLSMLTACGCDKPNQPQPMTNIEKPIYFFNRSGEQWLFKYLPSTQTMDSTIIQWDPDRISVSADGKLLYLSLHTSIVVIDTDNYEFVGELPYITQSAVSVSNDNKLIAITGETLRIIRTSDYKVMYADSNVKTYRGTFSHDNSAFYCGYIDSLNLSAVYKLELNSPNYIKTTKSFENIGIGVRSILPTHDEKKWIIYAGIKFFIYEVASDSMIFQGIVYPGSGTAVLSPDSKKVYLTGPGSLANWEIIPPYVIVVDIENNKLDKIIDSTVFYTDSSDFASPNDLIITQDNKYLGVLNGYFGLDMFHLIDLETFTVVDKIDYRPNQYNLTPMTLNNVK